MTALTIYNLLSKFINSLIYCISLLCILINQKLDQKKISKFTRMKFIKIVSTIFNIRLLRIFFKKCFVQLRDKEAEDISPIDLFTFTYYATDSLVGGDAVKKFPGAL